MLPSALRKPVPVLRAGETYAYRSTSGLDSSQGNTPLRKFRCSSSLPFAWKLSTQTGLPFAILMALVMTFLKSWICSSDAVQIQCTQTKLMLQPAASHKSRNWDSHARSRSGCVTVGEPSLTSFAYGCIFFRNRSTAS